jgi:hypothetical protein
MMVRYKESAKLQRQAAWAVLSLCGTDEISRLVALRGGDSAIMNAMLHHRYGAAPSLWMYSSFFICFFFSSSILVFGDGGGDVDVCCVRHPRRHRIFYVMFGVETCSAAT